uniref:Band 7 domain-containing protein n=1 Tax=Hemiselmis andersenii TaxID=464988 RepID=A0A6T8I7S2_HEMAN|mmetsp:Transcript_26897/g.62305  ORF Transcript_26897/g.62305 Transcript_26897/m.62305 type:complete len:460 (+) Transcript_26897:78-1457(+)
MQPGEEHSPTFAPVSQAADYHAGPIEAPDSFSPLERLEPSVVREASSILETSPVPTHSGVAPAILQNVREDSRGGVSAEGASLDTNSFSMSGFPAEDLEECLGERYVYKTTGCCCLLVCLLCAILIPSSIEKVSSSEVALTYDKLGSMLGSAVLSEGLQTKPAFGYLIKWPITNQRTDLTLTCNSKDAIQIAIELDFLSLPVVSDIRLLTLKFIDFNGYKDVVTSVSRSSVRNACGGWTAREFQTNRAAVAKSMEDALRMDLANKMSTTVLTLNLRNVDRPEGYQNAVDISEAALADIELAKKEEEQQLIKANTVLEQAMVEANKTIDFAETEADVMVAKAENEVKLAARADVDLALEEREQLLTRAGTSLQAAHITANVTLAAARTRAEVTRREAEQMHASLVDRYEKFASLLNRTMVANSLDGKGVLAYLGNSLVGRGGRQQVAIDSPAQFSWKGEL